MSETIVTAQRKLDEALSSLSAATPVTRDDPAIARLGGRALAQHHRNTDRDLRRYVEALSRVDRAQSALNTAKARAKEEARVRLTSDDLRGATAVRDDCGWHRVVRVNAKTVTVETPYSWTDRIAIEKVLQVAGGERNG